MNQDLEEWIDIETNGPEHYQVSNLGRIRSVCITVIRPFVNRKTGIPRVNLYLRGKIFPVRIDEIVAGYFLDEKEDFHTDVIHIDGDKMNCHPSNLKWGVELKTKELKSHQALSCAHNRLNAILEVHGVDKEEYLESLSSTNWIHLTANFPNRFGKKQIKDMIAEQAE
jgi:hypothetical protein